MDDDMVLFCRRGVDFSIASVRARSASTRVRTWSRSKGDIIMLLLAIIVARRLR
jgi:hypothetical protein